MAPDNLPDLERFKSDLLQRDGSEADLDNVLGLTREEDPELDTAAEA